LSKKLKEQIRYIGRNSRNFRGLNQLFWYGLNRMLGKRSINNEPIHPFVYWCWRKIAGSLPNATRVDTKEITDVHVQVTVAVVCHKSNVNRLPTTVKSLVQQSHNAWKLLVIADNTIDLSELTTLDQRVSINLVDAASNLADRLNHALMLSEGKWFGVMAPGDSLEPSAISLIVMLGESSSKCVMVYSDNDWINANNQLVYPQFKSEWNFDLVLTHNYVGRLCLMQRELMLQLSGFGTQSGDDCEHELLLRYVSNFQSLILHLPKVVYHQSSLNYLAQSGARTEVAKSALGRAIVQAAKSRGSSVTVSWDARQPRIKGNIPQIKPLVSIIIPTRNGLNLLKQCVKSIQFRTKYSPIEILILDNDSDEPLVLDYLILLSTFENVRVIKRSGAFNFSDINNFAVQHARGDVLAFVNNDVEVITNDWLDELVGFALQENIGAVGPLLLYPDNSIQHSGVVLGIGGVAGHKGRGLTLSEDNLSSAHAYVQTVSAVTAACMVIKKERFLIAGGFDSTNLAVAYNDVDLCLRLSQLGFRNVFTPNARLYHHESATRGAELGPLNKARFEKETQYMKATWRLTLQSDPFYNPNLTLDHEDMSLAWPSRLE
jgi:O-antigen biosynthesis protein